MMSSDDRKHDAIRPVRTAAAVREILRSDIVEGRLPPGVRLPTHLQLVERFGVSNVTIQHALNQLANDGFIDVRPRVGSFVVDQPPHLRHVGLVFPFDPAASSEQFNWSKYYQSLTLAASEIERETGRQLSLFHGVDYHSDSEDRERLIRHISRRQLAGIIFAGAPYMYTHTPLVDAPGVARVELSSAQSARWPVINIWSQQWLAAALDRLIAGGHRRIAMLFHRLSRNDLHRADVIDQLLASRGLTCPNRWRLAADWRDPMAVNHLIQLLFRSAPEERPEALVVTDDNLIEGTTAGLLEAGIRVPGDVEVVALTNHPMPVAPVLPFHLLSYDLCAVLRHAIALIDDQIRDVATPALTRIMPQWQDEIVAAATSHTAHPSPGVPA